MNALGLLGWACLFAAMIPALRMNLLDRQMQKFRVPDADPRAYWFVPIRWQRRLYTGAGQHLVGRAWRTMALMYALAFLGIALVLGGSH